MQPAKTSLASALDTAEGGWVGQASCVGEGEVSGDGPFQKGKGEGWGDEGQQGKEDGRGERRSGSGRAKLRG